MVWQYRLKNGRQKTLDQIADEFHVQHERVRQIQQELIVRIGKRLKNMGYRKEDFL